MMDCVVKQGNDQSRSGFKNGDGLFFNQLPKAGKVDLSSLRTQNQPASASQSTHNVGSKEVESKACNLKEPDIEGVHLVLLPPSEAHVLQTGMRDKHSFG